MRASVSPLLLAALTATTSAPAQELPKRVVIVAVDARTQEAFGAFGGHYRARHADLIAALDKAGARAIAFTMSFGPNPDQAAGTRAMANAIAASKARVVLSTWAEKGPDGVVHVEPNDPLLVASRALHASAFAQDEALVGGRPGDVSFSNGERVVWSSADGVPALPIQVLSSLGARVPRDLVERVTVGVVPATGELIQVPAIRPRVVKGRPPTISYLDVLRGKVRPELLEGAIVLVGLDDGVNDLVDPRSPLAPGVSSLPNVQLQAWALRRALGDPRQQAQPAAEAGQPRTGLIQQLPGGTPR